MKFIVFYCDGIEQKVPFVKVGWIPRVEDTILLGGNRYKVLGVLFIIPSEDVNITLQKL